MKKHNLVEVNTNFNYEKIPFGIYLNDNKFKELNNLFKIIKNEFEINNE